jgi:hypothetical protein
MDHSAPSASSASPGTTMVPHKSLDDAPAEQSDEASRAWVQARRPALEDWLARAPKPLSDEQAIQMYTNLMSDRIAPSDTPDHAVQPLPRAIQQLIGQYNTVCQDEIIVHGGEKEGSENRFIALTVLPRTHVDDPTLLSAVNTRKGIIKIWNIRNGTCMHTFTLPMWNIDAPVCTLHKDAFIILTHQGTYGWNIATGKPLPMTSQFRDRIATHVYNTVAMPNGALVSILDKDDLSILLKNRGIAQKLHSVPSRVYDWISHAKPSHHNKTPQPGVYLYDPMIDQHNSNAILEMIHPEMTHSNACRLLPHRGGFIFQSRNRAIFYNAKTQQQTDLSTIKDVHGRTINFSDTISSFDGHIFASKQSDLKELRIDPSAPHALEYVQIDSRIPQDSPVTLGAMHNYCAYELDTQTNEDVIHIQDYLTIPDDLEKTNRTYPLAHDPFCSVTALPDGRYALALEGGEIRIISYPDPFVANVEKLIEKYAKPNPKVEKSAPLPSPTRPSPPSQSIQSSPAPEPIAASQQQPQTPLPEAVAQSAEPATPPREHNANRTPSHHRRSWLWYTQHPWFTPAAVGTAIAALGAVATYFWWKKKQ